MQIFLAPLELTLRHPWTIGRDVKALTAGRTAARNILVTLVDEKGLAGIGEAAPSARYGESFESAVAFLQSVDPKPLSFYRVENSVEYLEGLGGGQQAAKAALNMALLDGAARAKHQSVSRLLQLEPGQSARVTSFSIGIDTPEVVERKVRMAESFPILKLKLGSSQDFENLSALRRIAPEKIVRLDANEAWKSAEEALENIGRLAMDPFIEFVEQPMPQETTEEEWRYLKRNSRLPLFADESYRDASDLERCRECFHGVNVKVMKAGGVTHAAEALRAASSAGLQTMLGCMIESSLAITAAFHLAPLADHLDLDGHLLVANDPFHGAGIRKGAMSFDSAPELLGLRVRPRLPVESQHDSDTCR